MPELNLSFRPELRRPGLVGAFRGWNDGGQGATLGAGYLAKQWGASRFAEIDPESFYDFQATRPHVSLEEGMTRKLDWPDNGFFPSEIPGTERDAVILLGTEPNLRWRSFSELVLGPAKALEVERVVTFGSLLADVPHTRPAPVTAAATDEALMDELGLEPSRYEGPTGIVGVLLDACRQAGLSSLSLWAAVPHYVSLAPSPRAALALVRRVGVLMQSRGRGAGAPQRAAGGVSASPAPRRPATAPGPRPSSRLRRLLPRVSSSVAGGGACSAPASAPAGSPTARAQLPEPCRASRVPRRSASSRGACSPR